MTAGNLAVFEYKILKTNILYLVFIRFRFIDSKNPLYLNNFKNLSDISIFLRNCSCENFNHQPLSLNGKRYVFVCSAPIKPGIFHNWYPLFKIKYPVCASIGNHDDDGN